MRFQKSSEYSDRNKKIKVKMTEAPTNLAERVLDLVLVGRLEADTHHPGDGFQRLHLVHF